MRNPDDLARHAGHYLAAVFLIAFCVFMAFNEPTWHTLSTYQGAGSARTAPTFSMQDAYWQLAWSCDPHAYGADYHLTITVGGDIANAGEVIVDETCHDPTNTHGEVQAFDNGDYLYFEVTAPAGAGWTLQVQAMR
jgi:hypothetical protein